jgi:hypothetical protein
VIKQRTIRMRSVSLRGGAVFPGCSFFFSSIT